MIPILLLTSLASGILADLAAVVDTQLCSCDHTTDVTATVTRIVDGERTILCQHCYDAVLSQDQLARRRAIPGLAEGEGECFDCGRISSVCTIIRHNKDLDLSMCDRCYNNCRQFQTTSDSLYKLKRGIMPNKIHELLYIGPKESAFDREVLAQLNITRVLICWEQLPAYHFPTDPSIQYHRLPVEDSLSQSIEEFLPSAMSFIARAMLDGAGCLVHCNAGVSRSGTVIVEWIRRTQVPSIVLDDALRFAKQCRSLITPNSNFMQQLQQLTLPQVILLGDSTIDNIVWVQPRKYANTVSGQINAYYATEPRPLLQQWLIWPQMDSHLTTFFMEIFPAFRTVPV